MTIKGYKVVDADWTCHLGSRKVIFADHGIFEDTPGVIGLASHGFHFCRRLINCFSHYPFAPFQNHVLEIEVLGGIRDDDLKSCTDKFRVIREIPWEEVLELVNIGKNNMGKENYGNDNVGDNNYGNSNKGNGNCGNNNRGNHNKGNNNIGSYNYATNCIGFGNTIDNIGTLENVAISNQLTGKSLAYYEKRPPSSLKFLTIWKASPNREEMHDIEEAEYCNGYLIKK